jgi:hypothetical protein
MKTSLNKILETEEYLLKKCAIDDKLLFEAELILNPELKQNLFWQKKTYRLIDLYGKKQIKKELEQVHGKLFSDQKYQSYREKILTFFGK